MQTILKTTLPRYIAFPMAGAMISGLVCFFFSHSALAQVPVPAGGFVIQEIRFKEGTGGKKPTPKIPATWRFVGVSNGEKMNTNNLWFQDKDGTIYLVHGFMANGYFIVEDIVQKVCAGE